MPPRRAAAAICLMAGLALPAVLAALPQPAAASTGRAKSPVTVAITAVNPGYARPGERVTVQGLVTSNSSAPLRGVTIQLMSSSRWFTVRDELQQYEAGGDPAAVVPVHRAVGRIRGVLRPHATLRWRAELPVSEVHMTEFGVYPLAAQATDQTGIVQGTDYTFLPFWPSAHSKLRPRRDDVAWLWPMIDTPDQGPCPGLLNNNLAASLTSGGRLARLLGAGASAEGRAAQLTWALDPAVLSSAQTMAGGRHGKARYTTDAKASCSQGTSHPASAAARSWLDQLRSAVSGQPSFVTPYADADITALTKANLENDLHRAFLLGRSVADDVLGRSFAPKPGRPGHPTAASLLSAAAWPADGLVSYAMLPNLAAVNGVRMVVLSSAAMPPKDPQLNYTPSAVSHALNGVGGDMRILLADATLTHVLGRADARTVTPATTFATKQRFLAETAMIAAQAPHLSRAIVVAPPRRWNPRAGLAGSLLRATDSAPWLSPVSAGSLAADRHAPGQVPRQPPHNAGAHRFRRALVRAIKVADRGVALVQSLRVQPSDQLYWAVAGVESSAWRSKRSPHRPARALLHRVTAYVAKQESGVSIIGQGRTTLGGKKGKVPVSVSNQLGYTVRVRIRLHVSQTLGGGFSVVPSPGVDRADSNTVVTNVIQVQARSVSTTKVQVRADAVGTTTISMRLLTPNGQALPGHIATMTVQATHFGTFALVILAAALGVFMITSAGRAIRRGRTPATDSEGRPEPADEDGQEEAAGEKDQVDEDAPARSGGEGHEQPEGTDNVGHDRARSDAAGTDHVQTEDADDYARVPGWADRG